MMTTQVLTRRRATTCPAQESLSKSSRTERMTLSLATFRHGLPGGTPSRHGPGRLRSSRTPLGRT
eukprot:6661352-Lingulodinium_polyedra.AAC.1